MLPDFPDLKKTLRKNTDLLFEQAVRTQSYVTSELSAFLQHEGNKCTCETVDGEINEMNYKEIGTSITIKLDEAPELDPTKIREKISTAAREIVKQQMGMFFTTIEGIAEKTGNKVDARGKPFTPELVHELLRKIQIDFDDEGNPYLPSIIVGPDVAKQIEGKFEEWEKDPKFKKEFDKIIRIKREEWRDRESNRKLVD